MPRIELVAAGVSDGRVLHLVSRAAEDAGLRVEDPPHDRADLRLRAGSLAMAILFGAFILYVDAAVTIKRSRRDEIAVVIDWSSPWWTGLIGCGRTRSALTHLVNSLEDDIEDAGGEVLDRVG